MGANQGARFEAKGPITGTESVAGSASWHRVAYPALKGEDLDEIESAVGGHIVGFVHRSHR